jgi:CheY-like chemotaxis protein
MQMYKFKEVYQYTKNLHVLYVEDDENLAEETSDILEDFFASVTLAVDGVEGIQTYNAFKETTNRYFDLVITDINMPCKDGLAMIKDINQINPLQYIIVVSAYSESERLIDLIQEGIANFVMKPLEPTQLMKVLYKSCYSIYNQKLKDNHLIERSRFAAMGEMIDSIAHQWLQPINVLKMNTEILRLDNEIDALNKKYIETYILNHLEQTTHMIETLDEFRNFFRMDYQLIETSYKEIVESVEVLLKDNLIKHAIQTEIDLNDEDKIKIIPNEFKHILINIVNNALEAFEENHISDRKLIFTSEVSDTEVVLYIEDTAGGIPKNMIENIFEANFTTKEKGTGVGLYLSAMIIEKVNGKISVSNVENGAKFKISLKV